MNRLLVAWMVVSLLLFLPLLVWVLGFATAQSFYVFTHTPSMFMLGMIITINLLAAIISMDHYEKKFQRKLLQH